jgi:Family of unknown function (DUF5995)
VQYILSMISVSRLITGASFAVATAITIAVTVAVPPADATTFSALSTACGTSLSGSEIATIVQLSNTSAITSTDPLVRYNTEVADNQQITAILVAHKDYRGLFAVGLDASERSSLQPLQQNAGNFTDPTFARKFSGALLGHWLDAVHAQFTGAVAAPEWQFYFALAHVCSTSKTLIALTGYNSHLNVDVAEALADADATPADEADYVEIVDAVAASSPVLISATQSAYGANIGPVWQVILSEAGTITEEAFANGLALQVPSTAPAAVVAIFDAWRSTEEQLPGLIAEYGG